MQDNFAKAIPRILAYEGGKVEDPRDPGGRTNQGITQATFNAWLREQGMPSADVYSITTDEVSTIYKNKYWDLISADSLPAGLDLCVFDAAVNSGVGQAGKWLQRSLGDKFAANVDGIIGVKTLQAVEDFGDVETLINAFCSRRLATLKSLSTWGAFGKGWSARIANVQKTADSWATGGPAPNPVSAGGNKAPITGVKPNPVSQIAAHATTVATGAGTVAAQATTQLSPLTATFGWVRYVLGAATICSFVAGVVIMLSQNARNAAEAGTATAAVNIDADAGHPAVPVNDAKPPPVTILPPPKASA